MQDMPHQIDLRVSMAGMTSIDQPRQPSVLHTAESTEKSREVAKLQLKLRM